MSDARFNRIEDKVDKIDDKVEKINLELVDMKHEFRSQNDLIRVHILGDNKIIDVLEPLIPQLREMTEDYGFQKQQSKLRMKAFKKYSIYFGAASAFASLIGGVVKIFDLL